MSNQKKIKNIFTPSNQKFMHGAAQLIAKSVKGNFVGGYSPKTLMQKNICYLNQLEMLEGRINFSNKFKIDLNKRSKLSEIEKRLVKRNNESKFKLNIEELEYLKSRTIQLWEKILDSYKIDCILFEDIPHEINDWFLYNLAKKRKIFCAGLTPVLGSRGTFSWTEYDKPGIIAKNIISGLNIKNAFYNQAVINYMNSLDGISHRESMQKFLCDQDISVLLDENKFSLVGASLKILGNMKNKLKEFYRHIKYKKFYLTDIWLVNFDKNYVSGYKNYLEEINLSKRKKIINKNFYKKSSINSIPDGCKKYVIVCLQYQPEVSTCPVASPIMKTDIKFFFNIYL